MVKLSEGNCYQAAAEFLLDSAPCAVLVHGAPVLTRHPFKKFGHAWVEVKVNDDLMIVRDTSNGQNITVPSHLYYSIGKIDPDKCQRYSIVDLAYWTKKTGHWGPWEEGPGETL